MWEGKICSNSDLVIDKGLEDLPKNNEEHIPKIKFSDLAQKENCASKDEDNVYLTPANKSKSTSGYKISKSYTSVHDEELTDSDMIENTGEETLVEFESTDEEQKVGYPLLLLLVYSLQPFLHHSASAEEDSYIFYAGWKQKQGFFCQL